MTCLSGTRCSSARAWQSSYSGCAWVMIAVQRGGLDADFAIRRDDCRVRTIECAALLGAGADAEGRSLAEEQLFKARGVGGTTEDGDECADATLLHDDGSGHRIERAMLKGELGSVRDDLRREVVDGALEDARLFRGRWCRRLPSDRFADAEAKDVRETRRIACAGTVADVLESMAVRRVKSQPRARSIAAPVGVTSSIAGPSLMWGCRAAAMLWQEQARESGHGRNRRSRCQR